MNYLSVFSIFLLVRLASVLLVVTWFVPDEYWQSLEVSHKLVYGYGYLTWEWKKGIRSYIHPVLIGCLYKLLNLIGLDSAEVLILLPRILQAVLSAYSDFCFWKWCGKTKWSIFCIASSWFWFYMGSRTLLNTVETCLTTIALSKFPFRKSLGNTDETSDNFVWLVGLACAIRPTAAIVWVPLCTYHLLTSKNSLNTFLTKYLLAGLSSLGLSCLVDSLGHGSFLISSWEFLKMNVLDGIGEWYGSHPWHWYLSQGIPAILGIQILPFMLAAVRVLQMRKMFTDELVLLGTITFTTAVFSCLSHKEFRFLLPLLPIFLRISSQFLTNWSRKANEILIWIVAVVILLGNAVPAVYWGQYHQRGTLDVMKPLREIAQKDPANTSLLFLMPCHSTPLYSHLHVNVTARFLTCTPNFGDKVEGYVDEADYFYRSPSAWLGNNYPRMEGLPTHIVTFDKLVPAISEVLSRYKPIYRIFHTYGSQGDERVGKYVLVHERIH